MVEVTEPEGIEMTHTNKALYGIAVGFITTGALVLCVAALRLSLFYPQEDKGVHIGASLLLLMGPALVAAGLVTALSAVIVTRSQRWRSHRHTKSTRQQ